jgi:hypothetical protein
MRLGSQSWLFWQIFSSPDSIPCLKNFRSIDTPSLLLPAPSPAPSCTSYGNRPTQI